LLLTSLKSGGRSVGIGGLRTDATEFNFIILYTSVLKAMFLDFKETHTELCLGYISKLPD
jgi:hypothetical protein